MGVMPVSNDVTVSNLQTADNDGAGLSKDQIFEMLSNRRRRLVLHYLKRNGEGPVDLRTLVDAVSSWEYETPADELPWKKRKRVYTALRQSHLPKLADIGAIEYDRQRGEVELTDDARELQMYLEYVPSNDIPWSLCYLGLVGVAAAITALCWFSVYPFANLTGLALASILVGMFGVSSIAHTVHSRRNRLGTAEPPR